VRLDLRVIPRSPRVATDGIREGRLVLRVTAPPVDHAANAAVIAALSSLLGVPKQSIRIVAGLTSRNKVVAVDRVTRAEVVRRLTLPA
jgi:uncharacterized protein YggU (UPF0235/DUF167 family)